MGKARGVDSKLTRLRLLRNEPLTPAIVAELRDALADKSNFVAAAAAQIVGEQTMAELAPELVAAFHRFMIDPAESDKTCRAKIAIMDALHRIDYDEEDVFRVGLRHRQPEPRWGGSDDTAAPVRATAAFALVRIGPRDLMFLLVDLLTDSETIARSAAAKALGATGTSAAVILLRFKAKTGDKEPEVVVECLNALMSVAAEESLAFVGQFLRSSDEEIAEGAALALGESRRGDAFELLKERWPSVQTGSFQNVLLLAIAITRLPAALDFLLEVLAKEDTTAALAALAALAIHKHNPTIRERIGSVIAQRDVAVLRDKFAKEFREKESR